MEPIKDVYNYLHNQREIERLAFGLQLDLVIDNAQKCWRFIYDTIRNKYDRELNAPYICISLNPIIVHFTWDNGNDELYFEIRSHKEIYICFNYGYGIKTGWKMYLQLDNLRTTEQLESALLIFTK